MGFHNVQSMDVPVLFVFGLMMAQWAETCRQSLIVDIDYQNIFCLLT
jgi:hypothetical protein